MYEINLPTLDWFMYGNVYTGSFRPDPAKGCLCQTTFNYKVKIIDNDNVPYLAASCFYMLPWNCYSNMDEIALSRFDATPFGIEVAENWIKNKFITDYQIGLPQNEQKFLPHQKRYINSCNICL